MSQLPEADIDVLEQITCLDNTAILDIGSSETGSDIHYEWNGPSANGATSTVIEPTEPGFYYLTYKSGNRMYANDSVLLTLLTTSGSGCRNYPPLCEGRHPEV
jgi:hypothetical protein